MRINLKNITDLTRHPLSGSQVLNTALSCWNEQPRELVYFIVAHGDGKALVARIRTRLSESRKLLKKNNIEFKKFSIKSSVHPWLDLGSTQSKKEIVELRRMIHLRHTNIMVGSDLEKTVRI